QAMNRLSNRREVSQGSAQPAGIHVEHPASIGFFVDRVLGMAFGPDEQQVLALRRESRHEFRGFFELLERLLQVDDVDAVALSKDESLHLRVPALGLMTKVDASLEQFLHGNRRQWHLTFSAFGGR